MKSYRLWACTGGEGAKFWMSVFTEIRHRGVEDVLFLVCDGLSEVIGNVWSPTTAQTRMIHLIRNTFRRAGPRPGDTVAGPGIDDQAGVPCCRALATRPRPMISRWISLVPSYRRSSRTSR